MMDLYQELIVDHGQRPRNFGPLACATHSSHGHNPLCGDDVEIFLVLKNGIIEDIRFTGKGCAISTASASLLLEAVKGKSAEDFQRLFKNFHAMMLGEDYDDLGKLNVLDGVKGYPMRIKCATLAWHTLKAALEESLSPQALVRQEINQE